MLTLERMEAAIAADLEAMNRRGRFRGDELRLGPNWVHAYVERGLSGRLGIPGSIEDLGWSPNLKTTVGMDWLHGSMGGLLPSGGQGSPSTAIGGTSVTATGTPWTVNQLTGGRVYMPVTGLTTAPVYGNIGSNTAGVITVDQWWTGADGLGTTPASGNALLLPGGFLGPARFIGLTTDVTAPAVGDTTLASEITTNGLARALAAFAHSGGATTFTLTKTFASTGTFTAVHKAGLFTALTLTAAGTLVADTVLNADTNLVNGDNFTVTWTWTLPAAG